MIFYFSGTGNTKWAAAKLAAATHDSLISIAPYMRADDTKHDMAEPFTLQELRLVVRHSLVDGTKYEASSSNENHVHQVCTVCGRVTEVQAPLVTAAINETRLQRFRKDAFVLYIYGVCSACQAKITRLRNNKNEKSK